MKCIELDLKTNERGYIRLCVQNASIGLNKGVYLHRAVWEHINGSIPDGYEIHHTCCNRKCTNINHLKMVTRLEHNRITRQDFKRRRQTQYLTAEDTVQSLKDKGISETTAYRWIKERDCT